MFNRLCYPEMSFNGKDSDKVPHAYVAYTDGAKDCVPLSFIINFPAKWREPRSKGGWDPTYLYKVFWSPSENDSPQNMLKRVAKIPVYDGETSLEKPGYYRAAVLKVKGLLT